MENYKNLFNIRKEALDKAHLKRDYKEKLRIYNEQTIYNPIDNQNTPEVLIRLRSSYRGTTLEYLNKLYFETLEKIIQANRESNINELLFNCQVSLGLIEPLIHYNYKHYNRFPNKSILAIEKGLIYNSVNGIIGQVKNISDIVHFFEELNLFHSHVELAFERREVSSKIYRLIKNSGKLKQSKIKNELNIENGRFIASTVGYMIKSKKIEKYKVGKDTFLKIK
jgi:hypothetical protein